MTNGQRIASLINTLEVAQAMRAKADTSSSDYWLWKAAYFEAVLDLVAEGIPHVHADTAADQLSLAQLMQEAA